MRKWVSIVTICLIILSVFSGCGITQMFGGNKDADNDELTPVSSIVMGEDEAKRLTDKTPVHLYFANKEQTKLVKEIRYVSASEANKSENSLATLIVKELIAGPKKEGLKATLPKESKLFKPVAIKDGVATVDMSKDFVTKHSGEKVQEQLTIYAIVNSLTEVKSIQKVKFLIEGKKQSRYKGNFQFDLLFPRAPGIIAAEAPASDTAVDESAAGKDAKEPAKKDETTPKDATPKDSTTQKDAADQNTNSSAGDIAEPDEDSNAGISEDENLE